MANNQISGIGVGGASILVIFILLCLTTFATLSMTTANADYNLTERTALATQQFYEADAQAQEILSRIDSLLVQSRRESASQEAYLHACAQRLAAELPDLEVDLLTQGALSVHYVVAAGDRSELVVSLQIPPEGAQRYVLTEWRLSPVGEWQPQLGGFVLWDGIL